MGTRSRCPIHDTALDPQGECSSCRGRTSEERPTHWGCLVLGLAVAVVVLVLFARRRFMADPTSIREAPGPAITTRHEPTIVRDVIDAGRTSAEGPVPSRFEHATFTERDPRGFLPELQARGERNLSSDYRATDESYEMVVPTNTADTDSLGLLVWISASQSGTLPKREWAPVLAAHHLVFIGPNRAGNEREVASRLGLALDSVLAARRRLNLDTRRLYVGGISGGAKTAFRALVYFPEVFHAGLLCAGIEYVRDVPIRSRPGSFWPQRIDTPSDFGLVRQRPIAITTGPKDFNYAQINDVATALEQDHFTHVAIFESPELTHDDPPAPVLERALDWLDGLAK